MNRRYFILSTAAGMLAGEALARRPRGQPIDLIQARTNLGLRPNEAGALPGTARAAQVLAANGLARAIAFRRTETVTQSPYSRQPEPGTKLRNGHAIRAFNLELARLVERSRRTGGFPLIVGGECSDLLGGLLGLRRTGGRGLVHLDGHSDFLQPAFYPPDRPLHSAAGMDLALATGRGEPLLTRWPGVAGPLAADADTFQLGERASAPPEQPLPLFAGTAITQLTLQRVRAIGLAEAAAQIAAYLAQRRIRAG